MSYGTLARARSLSGTPSTTLVSDADVTQALAFGDAQINTITGVSTWVSTDVEWAMIQSASEFYASSYIRRYFKDDDEKADLHAKAADDILLWILRNSSKVFTSGVTGRHSWPANENAGPYMSNASPEFVSSANQIDPGDV